MKNVGGAPVFSEFEITNPASGSTYRVAIRGVNPGENFCACPDFATNDLGTCKHVEFTLARLERKRGGKAALAQGFRPPYSEIYVQYGGERRVRFRRGADCPAALAKRAAALFTGDSLPAARFADLDRFLTAAHGAGHDVRCYEDALELIAQVRDGDARRRILDAAYPQGARSAALANLVATELYPYQAEGALFVARAGRCLIGDEMGLGKTVQAIAAVELFARHFGAERVLVVCPTSLKHQWQREIRRFAGRDAQVVGGLRAVRAQQYRAPSFCKITNYEAIAKDLESIAAWAPDVVIVDEAQRIKNWNTHAARALKRIASPYAIVLTGTPLENRLEELVSIVQFVDQHRLGPTWKLQHEHQIRDEGRVIGYRALDRLGTTLAPVLLRRRKAEVLRQLPERVDNTVFVPMTREQRQHHDENREIVARIVARWRKTGYLSDADQRRLTCALQNMRMSCNSTYLLDGKTDDCTKADELATLLDELFERPDAKAVVFSQWLRTHELIVRRLEARRWGYVLFNGSVPGEQRGALIDRFCNDPRCRVFLSTDAGGVGLNLQHAASTVVNMDLPWNPAVLEQRIGRVHRLGQTRGVQVVNFVAEGTIEEGMLSVLAFKKALFAGVLDGGETEVFLGGSRLAKFMESVDAVTSSTAGASAASEHPDKGETTRLPADLGETAKLPAALADEAYDRPDEAHIASAKLSGAVHGADPWAPLLTAGLALVETLVAATGASPGNGAGGESGGGVAANLLLETDPGTGRSYLKLPLPDPHALQRLGAALTNLLAGLAPHSPASLSARPDRIHDSKSAGRAAPRR
jgi:superfamily II DNA or RNA helicase